MNILSLLSNLVLPLSVAYTTIEGRAMIADLFAYWRSRRERKVVSLVVFTAGYFCGKLISCSKCLSFWLTLLLAGSLPLAVLASILFDSFDRFRFRYL